MEAYQWTNAAGVGRLNQQNEREDGCEEESQALNLADCQCFCHYLYCLGRTTNFFFISVSSIYRLNLCITVSMSAFIIMKFCGDKCFMYHFEVEKDFFNCLLFLESTNYGGLLQIKIQICIREEIQDSDSLKYSWVCTIKLFLSKKIYTIQVWKLSIFSSQELAQRLR